MGTKPERNDLTPRGPDDELDRKIHAAMRLKGWIIPQTVEDVLRAEAELDDEGCDDLPEELMDPYAILRRETPRPLKVRPLYSAGDREAEKHLARAARAGGESPPEIEGRMRHDRAAAEAVGADLSLSTFFQRLQQAGLDRDFVSRRLLPPSVSAALSDEHAGEGQDEETLTLRAADCISRVFGWSPAAVLGSKSSLQLDTAAVGGARFKLGARTDERRLGAYTVYAHFLALLILEATEEPRRGPVPTDPNEVIAEVHRTYGELTFGNALRYVWDLGIPVLPLNDPGAFHGACWRVEGRNVIVLKQQTKSAARWLFDLLHELWHVAQEPGVQNLAVIEASETADERRNSAEEREASRFSGDVVLDGRAEELAEICVNAAGGSVERLKAAVPRVAARHGVLTDSLANYMAFRLSLQGLNWWGAATNLQRTDVNPLQTARAALLDRVHLGRLNELDRELLRLALTDRPA